MMFGGFSSMPSAKVLLELLANPKELAAVIQLKLRVREIAKKNSQKRRGEHWDFCFGILIDVSRSFNIVIQQLGDEMRDAICIFYLVLRGLDTVEDDMALDVSVKRARLKSFWQDLEDDTFRMQCGDKEVYRTLMAKFPHVIKAYKELDTKYRTVISDITRRMGEGMLEFLDKGSMSTVKEYELYCHYVAGLVGIGLSNLFSESGLESHKVGQRTDLSNSMGLFLQKTNIIRDFREDLDDNRRWWPEEIWRQYTPDLQTFISKRPADRELALQCLNHMVANALEHVPHCIQYLRSIKDHQNFLFCAIPQVMAAYTLALVFNNEEVFQDTLKIRKGRTARIFMETRDLASVLDIFLDAFDIMETKVRVNAAQLSFFSNRPFRSNAAWHLRKIFNLHLRQYHVPRMFVSKSLPRFGDRLLFCHPIICRPTLYPLLLKTAFYLSSSALCVSRASVIFPLCWASRFQALPNLRLLNNSFSAYGLDFFTFSLYAGCASMNAGCGACLFAHLQFFKLNTLNFRLPVLVHFFLMAHSL
jgi:farnesyl-diphosphate farnesyltransferase